MIKYEGGLILYGIFIESPSIFLKNYMIKNIFEIRNVSKYFPGVVALDNIDLDIKESTIHCIAGENGAGKSTFIKILAGIVERSAGNIMFDGNVYNPRDIREAKSLGISTIFQELNTINQLTVEQNLTLGREKTRFGVVVRSEKHKKIFQILKKLEPNIPLKKRVSELIFAHKQIIEIAKAITDYTRVIIMDEPTASLSEKEIERLFSIIKDLKKNNITVIYITHILDEIFELGDYVTVLRDGNLIDNKKISEISSKTELIRMMIGKTVTESYVPSKINYDKKVLEVKDITTEKIFDIDFNLYEGEILGIFGPVGSGKTEIASMLYGLDSIKEGSVLINAKKVLKKEPKYLIREGLTLVPEERRGLGLFLNLNIRKNISIMNLKRVTKFGITSPKKERTIANKYIKMLNIKASSTDQEVRNLSGGNQQKVLISKCLNADTIVLMMDEPTKGIDVGAKEEIYNIIRSMSKQGKSLIVFSSELPEIVNLCDRIILLNNRRIVNILKNENINTEEIMHMVTEEKAN